MGVRSNRRVKRLVMWMVPRPRCEIIDDIQNRGTLPCQFRILYPELRWTEVRELREDPISVSGISINPGDETWDRIRPIRVVRMLSNAVNTNEVSQYI